MGQDEQDGVWRHKILFNIRYKVSFDDRDFRKEDMRDPREQVPDKEY